MMSHWRHRRFYTLEGKGQAHNSPGMGKKSGFFQSFAEYVSEQLDALEIFEADNPSMTPSQLWRSAYGSEEFGGRDSPLLLSMYDAQITTWLKIFPRHCFCKITKARSIWTV